MPTACQLRRRATFKPGRSFLARHAKRYLVDNIGSRNSFRVLYPSRYIKSRIGSPTCLNWPSRSVNTIELIEVSCSLSIYPAPLINDATCQFAIKPRALVIQFARRGQSGKIVSRGAWGRFVNMVGKTRACKLKLANLSFYHWHVSVPFCQRLKE